MAEDNVVELATEVAEERLAGALDETISGRRVFDVTGIGKVALRFPTREETRLGSIEYSRVFSEMLELGLKTEDEMKVVLEKRGIWTKDDEAKVDEIRAKIDSLIGKLGETKSRKAKKPIREQIAALRVEHLSLSQRKQRYLNNTAENKAEDAQMGYLISRVAHDPETNRPIWASYEDFKNESNQLAIAEITYQFMTFINGLPADFLDLLPEAKDEQAESGGQDGE